MDDDVVVDVVVGGGVVGVFALALAAMLALA